MPIVRNQPITPPPGAASRDLASLILRVGTGLSMILYNSWLMVQQGWGHLWRDEGWTLLNVITDLGLPTPIITSCVIASIYFFGSICLILGLFGRVPAMVMLVVTEIGCYYALQVGQIAHVELSVLYGILFVLHLILGSGRFSLDRYLSGLGRRRFRRKNPAEF